VEKCALLKAIAQYSKVCDERVVVSEVNWPIKGTGIWSPVDAGYQAPDFAGSELNVSEADYGHFMLRYLVLSLCSGFVDQVYWWRLVAHGFGLIDERAEGGWRPRPGFEMLTYFLKLLGDATFVEKLETEKDLYALRFEKNDQEIVMIWANGREYSGKWPCRVEEVRDVFGKETSLGVVHGSPIYLINSLRAE